MTQIHKCLHFFSSMTIVCNIISSPWVILLIVLTMRYPTLRPEKPVQPAHISGAATRCRHTMNDAHSLEMQRHCQLNAAISGLAGPSDNFARYPALKRLVEQNLSDQRLLLIRARRSLLRWAPCDQRLFIRWFGTSAAVARQAIWQCVNRELALNARYTAANFTGHVPLRANVFASVKPDEPGTIYIDGAYIPAPRFGFDGQASTLIHEMSHFKIIYGSKDLKYGRAECLALARNDPRAALQNADSISGWADEVGR